jgi:histone acetyltransferase (RNA polymerase elongator complex component)
MTIKHYTIPIFIPELACPFQCVFCNQRKITGKQLIPTKDEIIKTIEDHLVSFKRKERTVELGFFGGSFTGIPMDQQEEYLMLVQPFIRSGEVKSIRLSTRPDYIDLTVLEMLRVYHVSTIELGAQSMDDEVLKASLRGHTSVQTEQAARLILSSGFKLGLQMMIGLPGDALEKSMTTARKIISLGAHSTRIYPSVVIRDTALHSWYEKGRYKPLSLDEAVRWTAQILPLFEQSGVKVLRVGLHPSEGISSGDDLIAGPFHPNFRELVLTEIWHGLLEPLKMHSNRGKLEITVPKQEVNYAVGYQAKNRNELLNFYDSVDFVGDGSILKRENFQFQVYE